MGLRTEQATSEIAEPMSTKILDGNNIGTSDDMHHISELKSDRQK